MKSGVPGLRKFCHSIVARAQFKAAQHFLETEVPALIQSIQLWLEAAEQDTTLNIPSNLVPDVQTVGSIEIVHNTLTDSSSENAGRNRNLFRFK